MSQQTYTDATSVGKYGVQSVGGGWPRTDLLLENDADVLALITAVVNRQKDDFLGISEIELDADMDPVHMYGVLSDIAALALEEQRKIGVRWVHPSTAEFDEDVIVIGQHHSITMMGSQAKWTATLRTAKA